MDVEKVKLAMESLQRCQKCYSGYVEGIHFGLRICHGDTPLTPQNDRSETKKGLTGCPRGRSTYINRYYLQDTDDSFQVLPLYELMIQYINASPMENHGARVT